MRVVLQTGCIVKTDLQLQPADLGDSVRFKMMRTFKKKMLVRGSEGHVGTD